MLVSSLLESREPNRAAMRDHPGNDGGTAGPRGDRVIRRNTIAWGMPDVPVPPL